MNTGNLSATNEPLKRIRLAHKSGARELNLAKLKRLPHELTALTALQSLSLSRCLRLQDLQPLAGLTALQRLNLNSCTHVQDLKPLAALTTFFNQLGQASAMVKTGM